MLLGLVVSAVLAADALTEAPPPAVAPAVEPAEDPEVVERLSQERFVRIAGTLAGGAAGIALPMLGGFAGQLTQGPCPSPSFSGCTTDGPIAVATSFMPITYALGLAIPHHLLGGRAGFGFGLAGATAGYMATTSLLGLVSLSGNKDWMKSIPVPGGALIAAFSLIGGVAAMELRHDALTSGAKPWALGRGIAEGAAFWLPAVLVELGLVFGLEGLNRTGAFQWVPVLYVLGTVANFSAAALGAWGAHRALDGKGSYWTALVGGLASSLVALGFFAIHVHGPPANGVTGRNFSPSHMAIPIVIFSALIAAVGPSVGLEWSNARAPDLDEKKPLPGLDDLQVNLNGGFSPGGGFSFGLSGSF